MIRRLIGCVVLCVLLHGGFGISIKACPEQRRAGSVEGSSGASAAEEKAPETSAPNWERVATESSLIAAGNANWSDAAACPVPSAKAGGSSERGQVGVGIRLSFLGAGAEAAVSLSKHFNARGGFNYFSYSRDFSHDGVTYKGQLDLRSGEAHLDWSPLGQWFHLSPGVMIYNGNKLSGNANVPGNSTFTLGGATYLSDPSNPMGGKGRVEFRKVSPTAMIGFGNLVPRHKHFSASADLGVVFQGTARSTLQFTGNACAPNGTNCVNAATDPNVQANVLAEQTKINNKVSPFKYYPVLAFGFGYRF